MLFLLLLTNAFPFLGILAKSSDEALCYYYSVSSLTSLCFRVSCVLAKQLPGCGASFKGEEGLGLGQGASELRAPAPPPDCFCV